MEWVETTGRTIEEAKEAALDELGVDEHDAEFEVLEEPKPGLFGRIRAEGRVRARVRPTAPRAKEDRRDRRRRSRNAARTESPADADVAGGDESRPDGTSTAAETTAPDQDRDIPPSEPTRLGATSADERAATAPSRRRRTRAGQSATSRSERAEAGADPSDTAAGPTANDARSTGRRPEPPTTGVGHDEGENLMDVALDEQAAVAEGFITGLLDALALEAQVDVAVSEEDDRVEVRVEGGELGVLIGPKGTTLLAIQDLTRTAVIHRTSARNGHLYVDISGYQAKRAQALAAFARKIAADVLASGTPIALEPMSAADRKLVHDTITGIDGVETISVGEDERRHVVVRPVIDAAS